MLLGIDFGTTHTAAVLFQPDGGGAPVPLLFDASPLLLSGVHLAPDGQLLTGRDAARGALSDPGRSEPNPKLRIDDGNILLGDVEVPVHQVIAAVLRRVLDEAVRHAGLPVGRTVLTYPASWAAYRRDVLMRAAQEAGLPDVTLVLEPVAAAAFHARASGRPLPPGAVIMVYDLGGGTFDVSVLRRTADGWEIVASSGLDDVGGIDLDAALADHIGRTTGAADPRRWRRLLEPVDPAGRRALRGFRDDVRGAKEQLSRTTSATVRVPLLEAEAYLSRDEFEAVAAPLITRTVDLLDAVLRQAGVDPGGLTALYLVGGSSRIPLVATMLHRRFALAPALVDEPQLVVAIGCVFAAGTRVVAADPLPPPPPPRPATSPASAPPFGTAAQVAQRPPRGRGLAVAGVVALLLAAGLIIWGPGWFGGDSGNRGNGGAGLHGDSAAGQGTGTAAAPAGGRTFHIDKDAWYAGFQLHLDDAVYDPSKTDEELVLTARATNHASKDESVDYDVPVSVRFGSQPYSGSYDRTSTVPAGSYVQVTIRFRVRDRVDPATGVIVLGANSYKLATVPLTGTNGLVSLEPKPVLSPTQVEMHGLKFTNVQCATGAAVPELFRQVKSGDRSVHCTFDVGYTGSEIGIEAGAGAYRLIRPDGTEVAPEDAKVISLSGGDFERGLYVTFVIADAPGNYKLRLRYRGLYTRVTQDTDVPFTIPGAP
ncbi:Hsp70 family protein [Dactylosporangium darangshiense]|uniref:Hsp70 family protein n=1 Tax=Dactylosporangium darangshiense TaxID=579108 RepID=A0ABP8D8X7_9ACTN